MPQTDGFNPTSLITLGYGRQSARGVDPSVIRKIFANSVAAFGGQDTKIPRQYFNEARQLGLANLVDRDAVANIQVDLTKNEITELWQSLFFSVAHEKACTQPLNGSSVTITAVDGTNDQYEAASGLTTAPHQFRAGDIILASGFGVAANNGIKVLDAVAAAAVDTVEDLTAEASPPATAMIRTVGFQGAADDITITNSGSAFPVLGSTTKDFTELGLSEGEWFRIGGDASGLRFGTAASNCWARARTIAANAITIDKSTSTIVTDTGSGKTVQLFFGTHFRNELTAALIVQILFKLERTLGSDGSGTIAQYVLDSILNKATFSIEKAGKATVDLEFLGSTASIQTGVQSATRPALTPDDFLNTSTNVLRIKTAVKSTTNANPTSLTRYEDSVEIVIDNGAQPVKVVGTLGAIGAVPDLFRVTASLNNLLDRTDIQAAALANTQLDFDTILYQSNGGLVFDGPRCTANAPSIEGEQGPNAIREPIELIFADSTDSGGARNTFTLTQFPYLPTAAGTL